NSPDSSVPHDWHDSRVRARVAPHTGQSCGAWRGWSCITASLVARHPHASEFDLDVEASAPAADERLARVGAEQAGPAVAGLPVADGDGAEVGLGGDPHARPRLEMELHRPCVAADVRVA